MAQTTRQIDMIVFVVIKFYSFRSAYSTLLINGLINCLFIY